VAAGDEDGGAASQPPADEEAEAPATGGAGSSAGSTEEPAGTGATKRAGGIELLGNRLAVRGSFTTSRLRCASGCRLKVALPGGRAVPVRLAAGKAATVRVPVTGALRKRLARGQSVRTVLRVAAGRRMHRLPVVLLPAARR
jgi:hypothetical protein